MHKNLQHIKSSIKREALTEKHLQVNEKLMSFLRVSGLIKNYNPETVFSF